MAFLTSLTQVKSRRQRPMPDDLAAGAAHAEGGLFHPLRDLLHGLLGGEHNGAQQMCRARPSIRSTSSPDRPTDNAGSPCKGLAPGGSSIRSPAGSAILTGHSPQISTAPLLAEEPAQARVERAALARHKVL